MVDRSLLRTSVEVRVGLRPRSQSTLHSYHIGCEARSSAPGVRGLDRQSSCRGPAGIYRHAALGPEMNSCRVNIQYLAMMMIIIIITIMTI